MAHDVFISYSSQDKPTAEAVCHALEAAAVRCWVAPRDASPGRQYQGSIVRAIRGCRVMVLVFSDGANASAHVTREVAIAADEGKAVVPFRIEEVELSDDLHYYISSVHWLDALSPPLERHLGRLVASVRALLPDPETTAPETGGGGPLRPDEGGAQGEPAGPLPGPEPPRPGPPIPGPPRRADRPRMAGALVVDGGRASAGSALLTWAVVGALSGLLSAGLSAALLSDVVNDLAYPLYDVGPLLLGGLVFGGAVALVGEYAGRSALWKGSKPLGVALALGGSAVGWGLAYLIWSGASRWEDVSGAPDTVVVYAPTAVDYVLCGLVGASVAVLPLLWRWRLTRRTWAYAALVAAAGALGGGLGSLATSRWGLFVVWQSLALAAIAAAPLVARPDAEAAADGAGGPGGWTAPRWLQVGLASALVVLWGGALWPGYGGDLIGALAGRGPEASIECPTELAVGEEGAFSAWINDDAARPVESWWEWGDGTTSSGLAASHGYEAEGTYTVTYTAENGAGTDNVSCLVTVVAPSAAEPQGGPAPEEGRGACDRVTALNPVFLGYGATTLTADARARLDENVEILRRCSDICVTIDAYSDGSEPGDALRISQARADAVLQYYVSQGIDRDRLRAVGRGGDPDADSEGDPGPGDSRARRGDSLPVRCNGDAR